MYAASTAAVKRASVEADNGCPAAGRVVGLVFSLVLCDMALSFCS
jgi:hypothetical protein